LVFSFHGIGHEFSGALVCAPFLDFRDTDEDSQNRSTMIPVAEEPFIFFHNDDEGKLHSRFAVWLDQVLKVAISQFAESY
jgi:hypothetical protein